MSDSTDIEGTAHVSMNEKHDHDEKHQRHDHAAPHDALSAIESGVREADSDTIQGSNPLWRWVTRFEALIGVESRGIERVPEEEKADKTTTADYMQMALIWMSGNLTANNIVLGALGPMSYYLGMTDAMIIGTFGTLFGAVGAAYISSFGPSSGLRTMAFARFTMGWWASRICVILNCVIMLGYGLVDSLTAGQTLSAVAGGGMSVIVGTIIAAIITLVVVVFGNKVFHTYERYAFLPQALMYFILIGVAGPYFAPGTQSTGGTVVVRADRLSFFFLCVSSPIAWAPAACDYYVYFPVSASRFKVFLCTALGLGFSSTFVVLLGIGLGSAAVVHPDWADAYNTSAGALIQKGFSPLGAFGNFCSVIIALGLVGQTVLCAYSAAISIQVMGSWFQSVPRSIWSIVGIVLYTVCACAGRNQFYSIFNNFIALMGYWVGIWLTITLEEQLIFRRTRGYVWQDWDRPEKLPVGLAALAAFLIGWAGAVLCMWQIWFTGPIAKLVGDGIDLGFPVGSSWAGLVYLPLRWLELKRFGR